MFLVPTHRLKTLNKRLDPINQQLNIWDQSPWEFKIAEELVTPVPFTASGRQVHHWSLLELTGELPKVGDMEIIGLGDSHREGVYEYLNEFPGEIAATQCDHCPQRPRRFTVLARLGGDYAQWGYDCFSRASGDKTTARALLDLTRRLLTLKRALPRELERAGSIHLPRYIPTRDFLAWTALILETSKFKSRKAWGFHGLTTGDQAFQRYVMSGPEPLKGSHYEKAEELLVWVGKEFTPYNRYGRLLKEIARKSWVSEQEYGVLAGVYRLQEIEKEEQELEELYGDSKPVGKIGEMVSLTVRVLRYHHTKGRFPKLSYLMVDEDGNQLRWLTSKYYAPGSVVRIRAKVKEHGERRGIPSTMLTYCRLIEDQTPKQKPKPLAKAIPVPAYAADYNDDIPF